MYEEFTIRAFNVLRDMICTPPIYPYLKILDDDSYIVQGDYWGGLIRININGIAQYCIPKGVETLIVYTIIHELFHSMQYIDTELYNDNTGYSTVTETIVEATSSGYFLDNLQYIQNVLGVTLYPGYLERCCGIFSRGMYQNNNPGKFWFDVINGLIISSAKPYILDFINTNDTVYFDIRTNRVSGVYTIKENGVYHIPPEKLILTHHYPEGYVYCGIEGNTIAVHVFVD